MLICQWCKKRILATVYTNKAVRGPNEPLRNYHRACYLEWFEASKSPDKVVRLGRRSGALVVALMLLCSPVKAQEIETGTGIICSEPQQLERFIELLEEDSETAIEQVNGEAKKAVCGIMRVVYQRHEVVKQVRHPKHGAAYIVRITLRALSMGFWQAIPPVVQYTIFLVKERGA